MNVKAIAYWTATLLVTSELGVGGVWDVLRVPYVHELTDRLGYPSYFLVILGTWKLLGMVALLAPRFPLLKEWAYAGVVFTDTGAIASHLTVGYAVGELAVLIPFLGLTALSWWSRPQSRRVMRSGPYGAAAGPAATHRVGASSIHATRPPSRRS